MTPVQALLQAHGIPPSPPRPATPEPRVRDKRIPPIGSIAQSTERRRSSPLEPARPDPQAHIGRCVKTVRFPRPAPDSLESEPVQRPPSLRATVAPAAEHAQADGGERELRNLFKERSSPWHLFPEVKTKEQEEQIRMAPLEAKRELELIQNAEEHKQPGGKVVWQSEVWNQGAKAEKEIARCDRELQRIATEPHETEKAHLVAMGVRDWQAEKQRVMELGA